jgi:NAD(P)H dehydrogenase (quinone)
MDQPLIAVTGATGAVGGRVARELARAGARQVLLVRDPSRAPELPGAEVRRIAGYAAGDDVRAALEGADTLFLVPGAEAADRVEQHKTAVDAAVAVSATTWPPPSPRCSTVTVTTAARTTSPVPRRSPSPRRPR